MKADPRYAVKTALFLALVLSAPVARSQAARGFSILTDLSLLRSFSKGHSFTTVGQTVGANFHLAPQNGVYAQVSYYVNGKSTNGMVAIEKDTAGGAAQLGYNTTSRLRYTQFSLGWKHYFLHSFDNEQGLNIYGTAGFGLMSARVENTQDRTIDTARYSVPPYSMGGTGRFTRLTFDLSLGAERAVAAGFFWYGEVRTWLQASSHPSPYLYDNGAPRVLLLNTGVRILFD
jgi:hypothetical protein